MFFLLKKINFRTLLILFILLVGNTYAQDFNSKYLATNPNGQVWEVTAPNGQVWEVTAPKGATKKQVIEYAKETLEIEERGRPSKSTKNTALSPPAIITLSLAIIFALYAFFSKLDSDQKIRLLMLSSVAWIIYVYFFVAHKINDKFFINTMPVWLFWSFYFIRGKNDLSFKFSITDYASTMFDHDVYVSGKRNFIHVLLGFLTSYFVLFFLPKDGILKVLPIIIIAITAWLVAVLPLNIAKEKKIIVNNKQQNIWLIYCLFAWPIALIHSIVRKKIIQPENNEDKKCDYELFHGGDGLSKNSPVSINCASMEVAKSSMDIFIKDNCGDDCKRIDLEYTIANPNDSEKLIKVIPVTKPDGTTMEFFFDLSRQVNNFTNMVKMFGDKD
jgi:hypothetical protein